MLTPLLLLLQDPLNPEYGVVMAPFLNAQIHQHFFQVRLDMAVDDEDGGKGLSITEVRQRKMLVCGSEGGEGED